MTAPILSYAVGGKSSSKRCSRCHETLPITAFYVDKNRSQGVMSICKTCHKTRMREIRVAHELVPPHIPDSKKCIHCKKTLPSSAFVPSKSSCDGLRSWCSACLSEYRAQIREKTCAKCGKTLSSKMFSVNKKARDGLQSWCNSCVKVNYREWEHRTGRALPMDCSKDSSSYLGVHIAETLLSKYFEGIQAMPYGNPGYDFVCKRGYKIDVKCSCMRTAKNSPNHKFWAFSVGKNKIADYFMFLAFGDRKDLTPQYAWLVPGRDVNNKYTVHIAASKTCFWEKYSKPIEKMIACCDAMKEASDA